MLFYGVVIPGHIEIIVKKVGYVVISIAFYMYVVVNYFYIYYIFSYYACVAAGLGFGSSGSIGRIRRCGLG